MSELPPETNPVRAAWRDVEESFASAEPLELTILMPCLDEAETIGMCIDKASAFLQRSGVKGEVLIADNGSTDGSQEIASEPRRARRGGGGARIRRGADRRHPRGARPLRHHGRRRRFLRLRQSRRLRGEAARRLRRGHGQPLPRRHRRIGHAAAAPLSRQPGALLHRPAVLPQPHRRLPLRAARLLARCDAEAQPRFARHGVRLRDGGEGDARALSHHGGSDHPVAGRALAPAASQELARRLAASEAASGVRAALAVPLSRRGARLHGRADRRRRSFPAR